MKGLVKIKGNMGLAMKLNVVTAATRDYMKKNGAAPAAPAAAVASKSAAPAASSGGLKSAELFKQIGAAVDKDGAALAKKVNGIFQFIITPGAHDERGVSFTSCRALIFLVWFFCLGGAWNLDLKSATPSLTEGTKKADVTITVADADFIAIAQGKLNAQQVGSLMSLSLLLLRIPNSQ